MRRVPITTRRLVASEKNLRHEIVSQISTAGRVVGCSIARIGEIKWQSPKNRPDMFWLDVHFRKEIHYMKRSLVLFSFFALGVVMGAWTLQAQAQGGAPNPEREAARAKQLALEDSTPKLQITEEVLPLIVPGPT